MCLLRLMELDTMSLSPRQTGNQHNNTDVLWHLWEATRQKCSEKWHTGNWCLTPQQSSNSLSFVCAEISGQKLHDCCPHCLYSPYLTTCDSFSKIQVSIQVNETWCCHCNQTKFTDFTCKVQNTGQPQMLQTIAESLDSLYQVVRKLLWQGQKGIIVNCNKNKEKNLVWKYFHHTLYIQSSLHIRKFAIHGFA